MNPNIEVTSFDIKENLISKLFCSFNIKVCDYNIEVLEETSILKTFISKSNFNIGGGKVPDGRQTDPNHPMIPIFTVSRGGRLPSRCRHLIREFSSISAEKRTLAGLTQIVHPLPTAGATQRPSWVRPQRIGMLAG